MEKRFITRLKEFVEYYFAERRARQSATPIREQGSSSHNAWARIVRLSVPNLGTLILVAALLMADKVGALSLLTPNAVVVSTGTLAYQGRLANSSGQPLTQTVNMVFRLYNAPSGGTPLWTEQWTGSSSVQVSDGLFNVMLGSLTPIPQSVLTGNSNLFLGITVGTDSEMSPRIQLGSVPFATQALTVPDGSITKAKLAPDVSLVPPDGSITTAKMASKAVTAEKLADTLFRVHLASATTTNWSLSCNNNNYVIPGVSLDLSVSMSKTVLVDFSGLVRSSTPGSALYSSLFIDNQPAKATNGTQLIGGCRDGTAGVNFWCNASNTFAAVLPPGNHTIDTRVSCDAGSSGQVWTGVMRVVELP